MHSNDIIHGTTGQFLALFLAETLCDTLPRRLRSESACNSGFVTDVSVMVLYTTYETYRSADWIFAGYSRNCAVLLGYPAQR